MVGPLPQLYARVSASPGSHGPRGIPARKHMPGGEHLEPGDAQLGAGRRGGLLLRAGHRQPRTDTFRAFPCEAVGPSLRWAGQTAPEADTEHAALRRRFSHIRSAVAGNTTAAAASGDHRREPQPRLLAELGRARERQQRKFPSIERRRGTHSERPQRDHRAGRLRRGVASVGRAACTRPDRLLLSRHRDVAALRPRDG